MRVLVTGGAGYIGSHTVLTLLEQGHDVEVVDNLVNGKAEAVRRVGELAGRDVALHEVDLTDRTATHAVLGRGFDAVIHFAALKAVGESTQKPLEYYANNMGSTFTLLEAMRSHDVRTLVFSSSATVYGEKAPVPYVEDFQPLDSSSTYGQTKVMTERILTDVAAADPAWRVALLRYFNPVGAHPSGRIGEDPQGTPNNLVPFIAQVAVGRRERLSVFGGDYPTADGTCERDYIHVQDVAEGHVVALDAILADEPGVHAWNLGSGQGTSVLEMIHAFERASGREIPYDVVDRRPGDLPAFWADPSKAEQELGWTTSRTVDDMCRDTWTWQSQNPQGYDA
ncbi:MULTISPECIES: UDP-glucose 4-epimerase GalE [unclassified Aeromicrobium]|uniref:UDP-glucose 4-epimerase GalE n=1 Tax=unclassified Aeromicrobium TaxID=2633570 RepID=UPI000701158D|nr:MULTISPECIES: UDP-glucose 4-epimerase GalE [unclassified Aeromicrobium]KQP27811.1 UDP-glucose 4-epimerase [Aeromicrobium sp. Leaf272]KQP78439.1 UDP-glucose 4-epimerase [Aeromicrobium sp. Leaf289]KQP84149.1 UDP-glucose 4-epimerase [Aeromicrobium sp. Leaf291]